jgi:UDP-3-O-[3-hydroxymyristoyl] glucosamine N-acyltransferase
MLLSEVSNVGGVDLVRDGEFHTLGFLSYPHSGMLVFVESSRFLAKLGPTPEAICVITTPDLAGKMNFTGGYATCENPRRSFHLIHTHLAARGFYWTDFDTEIHPTACIHPRAYVAERNVRIGARTQVEANATILERSLIGSEVTIRAGAIIGSVGFMAMPRGESMREMIHAGGILLGDRVQVMANAVVASAIFHDCTQIGPGARIGNCAFVSHNVRVGIGSTIGHGALVAGYVEIGDDVWIGPGASLVNGISIGHRAHVAVGSVVIGNVEPEQRVAGNFAVGHRALLKHLASIRSGG